MTFHK